jgi:hypothetical protein
MLLLLLLRLLEQQTLLLPGQYAKFVAYCLSGQSAAAPCGQ